MAENEVKEEGCDVDDILCQLRVLTHLKGLRDTLGVDGFKTEFPELTAMIPGITEKIASRETTIQKALEKCNLAPISEIATEESSEIAKKVK